MLLFMDGFDHYALTDLLKKWSDAQSIASAIFINSSGGRRSTGCISFTSSGRNAIKNIPASSTLIVGAAVRVSTLATSGSLFSFLDGGSNQMNLFMNLDGTLAIRRNSTV